MKHFALTFWAACAMGAASAFTATAQVNPLDTANEDLFGTPEQPAPPPPAEDAAKQAATPKPEVTPDAEKTVEAATPPEPGTPEPAAEPAPQTPKMLEVPAAEEKEEATPEGQTQPAAEAETQTPPAESTTLQVSTAPQTIPGIEVESSDANDERITIDVEDQSLRDVINVFSRISKVNIIANDTIEGRVTVHLENVTWRDALESILDSVGLSLIEKKKGIFHVVSAADLATEPVKVDIINLNFISATNLVPVVQRMLIHSNATVMAMPAANVLVVKETTTQLTEIRKAVELVDKPRDQVYIEAKFVELNDTAIQNLGINWQVLEGYTISAGKLARELTINRRRVNQDAAGNLSLQQNSNQSTASSTGERERSRTFDGLLGAFSQNDDANNSQSVSTSTRSRANTVYNAAITGKNFEEMTVDPNTGSVTMESIIPYDRTDVRTAVLSAQDFALTLSALKQMDGVSIVSNPKLLVSNGETATIHIGRNEPNIVAVPQGDTGDRFAYRLDDLRPFIEIGVKLEVQPTINTEDNITVRIAPELSRLLGEKIAGDANISFPITQIRRIETEFSLQSGKTVAIGGLTETNNRENIKKVPVLGDIPLIGKYLFTHKSEQKEQDEVIIFVSVNMGDPGKIEELDGIPSEGRLIRAHLRDKEIQKIKDASDATKEDEEIERILSKYRTMPEP